MQWHTDLPLIAILRGITPQEAVGHVSVLIEAGFKAIEVPLNSPQWQETLPLLIRQFGQQALIGAGTVLTSQQVEQLSAMGCQLIVTPNTDPAVIQRAVALEMVTYPGCATATEAFAALKAGAQGLKIFPSSAFGPDYIRALTAVLPEHTSIFAVGGVTPENLASWLAAGCCGAGLGSDLYRAGQPVSKTAHQAHAFVQAYKEAIV